MNKTLYYDTDTRLDTAVRYVQLAMGAVGMALAMLPIAALAIFTIL